MPDFDKVFSTFSKETRDLIAAKNAVLAHSMESYGHLQYLDNSVDALRRDTQQVLDKEIQVLEAQVEQVAGGILRVRGRNNAEIPLPIPINCKGPWVDQLRMKLESFRADKVKVDEVFAEKKAVFDYICSTRA